MTSLYAQSIPVLTKYLRNLFGILKKAANHADAKGIKHEELLTFRLIEDIRPLQYQVQSCSNTAKFLVSRVAGTDHVFFDDKEETFEQLQQRITKTIGVLDAVQPEQLVGKEEQQVIMETKMGNFKFTGQNYISEYAIPNFHFHLTTAYCIVRHLGVPVSAFDYLQDVFEKV